MHRLITTVVAVSAISVAATSFLADQRPNSTPVSEPASVQRVQSAESSSSQSQEIRLSGVESIPRSPNGHYKAEFRLNNSPVEGLIDTGATSIAINETTARRAGIRLKPKDFSYVVNTANGQTKAALAKIQRVQIGSIRVDDVEAFVLEDDALSTVLIGMSFMNRLKGFEYKSGRLILTR